ncbi:MAG: hypothetical protein GWP07_00375 [Xanthomonadaceae bacterium]|nr:hypothetical protein [Xanthomonadaceae bacterium]
MSCRRVSSALEKVDGITDVTMDKNKHTGEVTFDDEKVTIKVIKKTLMDISQPMLDEVQYLE